MLSSAVSSETPQACRPENSRLRFRKKKQIFYFNPTYSLTGSLPQCLCALAIVGYKRFIPTSDPTFEHTC